MAAPSQTTIQNKENLAMKCEKCWTDYPSVYHFKTESICTECFVKLSPQEQQSAIYASLMKHPLTSTTFTLEGYRIVKQLGVVKGLLVRSRSMFGTLGASLQTIVGGDITLFTELCEKTRSDAFEQMVYHAQQVGANAVVGIRYDTTELMESVTEVLCYGTAVIVEELPLD
jgi:uncharacterized protein YbjQ (UPF0145 family)